MRLKKLSRWKWGILAVAVLILLKIFSSCSQTKGALEAVYSAKVAKGTITVKVTTTGEVKPYNRVEIKPPIAGRVEEVLVKEGDPIHRGQVLAWMSSTERATLLDAATVKGQDEFKYWEEAYKPAPLISPLDGTLIVRSVEPGQTVANTNPVVVIADRLIVQAQVDETDLSLIKLGQEAEIRLDAYPERIIPGRVNEISYESQLVSNVNVYTVDVVPEQIPETFRSGMTANVTFIVTHLDQVLLVPSEAVTEWPRNIPKENSADFAIYVKKFGGKLKPVPVTTGQTDGRMTEIKSGLSEGDTIQIVRKKKSDNTTPFAAFGGRKRDQKGKT